MRRADRRSGIMETRSHDLLLRGQQGDAGAFDRLFARYAPQLRQWAHKRLPHWTRSLADTADLVQETMLHTLVNLREFKPRSDTALRAYLRRALVNRIRDQMRHARTRGDVRSIDDEVDTAPPGAAPSPLQAAIDNEDRERYVRALNELAAADRDAIVARVELGYTYDQLAILLDKPTRGAARVAVRRALTRLAKRMAAGAGR
jgi:RNA polymerase sigma factor (sigma-70 family)